MMEREPGDYLYPWQIWLLKAAPDDVLTKHKDIIKSDYEEYCKLARDRAVSQQAGIEAANWTETLMKDAKHEVSALKSMVREMNEWLPDLLHLPGPVFEQMMYGDALKVGKFGR
ncbi:hypothetical protein DOTSEDRAFT_25071 [Dothistroma septosporum NZE10]|uniref:Uncharacterized protein n=1 Tax=Dothistroma septosporum (strain NZE10 / CBS 128990) TaxID=675120 RepID=M2WM20_DOTSN|nr:hypothetical protein DOTSEDRAFT_25071 [Dothistroma septosporum NZE10]